MRRVFPIAAVLIVAAIVLAAVWQALGEAVSGGRSPWREGGGPYALPLQLALLVVAVGLGVVFRRSPTVRALGVGIACMAVVQLPLVLDLLVFRVNRPFADRLASAVGWCLPSLIVVVVAVPVAWRLWPARAERAAAGVALLAALLLQLAPWVAVEMNVHVRVAAGQAPPSISLVQALTDLLINAWWTGMPLAVACWLGARYRRVGWRALWRGPEGALVRATLLAVAIVLPLGFLAAWHRSQVQMQIVAQHAGSAFMAVRGDDWVRHLVMALSVTSPLTVAAILAAYRPSLLVGAFAGSGVVLGMSALGALTWLFGTQPAMLTLSDRLAITLPGLAVSMVQGAIAGALAGRWADEATVDD